MGSINSLGGCDQKEQLAKRRRSACRSCWRRFCHGLAGSGLVEGGVGFAIMYVVAVVADHGEQGRSCWLSTGGWKLFMLLVVRSCLPWVEGKGLVLTVDMFSTVHFVRVNNENIKIENARWEAWTNCFTKNPFVYTAAAAFQVNRRFKLFGKEKNEIYCSWTPLFTALQTQGKKKQLQAAFFANCVTTQNERRTTFSSSS